MDINYTECFFNFFLPEHLRSPDCCWFLLAPHGQSFLYKYLFIWTQLHWDLLLCNGKELVCCELQLVLIAGDFELKGHYCYQNSNCFSWK